MAAIDGLVNKAVNNINIKVNSLKTDLENVKSQVSVSETKLETAIEAKLIDTIEKDYKPTWASIVNKEVNSKFEEVSENVTKVKTALDDTMRKVDEEKERDSRSNNIIIFRVPETDVKEDRVKSDKAYCLRLFNEVLGVAVKDNDFKCFRLGKVDQSIRPLMVQCKEKSDKNKIMESLYKLRSAEPIFKNISITHDLSISERKECKTLVAEAKKKQLEESGEYLWRVRGPPGQIKLIKLKKRHSEN